MVAESSTHAPDTQENEVSWLTILTMLGNYKVLLFTLPLLAALVAVVLGLVLTPRYTARTTLISPPSGGSGGLSASTLGALGAFGAFGGALALGGAGAGNAEVWVTVLKSRSAKDDLIKLLNLEAKNEGLPKYRLYEKLDKTVRIFSDKKTSLITIDATDTDPVFAAQLANGHYTVLRKLMTRLAVTEAQQRRQFFEAQFAQAKTELANAEVAMKETQERTGVLELSSQALGTLNAVARLRAEVAQREVQLSALGTFVTSENTEMQRVRAEIASLRNEIVKLEKGGQGKNNLATGNLPTQGLAYVRALREVKYQEAIFEIMAKQYELAKVDEAKESGSMQQLDVAFPPEKRSFPKRTLWVLFAVLGGFVLACFVALGRAFTLRLAASDDHVSELAAVKRAWRLGRWPKA